jgi:hypothetical protein
MRRRQPTANRTGLTVVLLLVLMAMAIIAGGLALDAARAGIAGSGAAARPGAALAVPAAGTQTRGAR